MKTEIAGIPVEITRKRIRNLHLYVKPPDGRVEVTAPMILSNLVIREFVESKADWIRQKQAEILSRPVPRERRYETGETIHVWGKPYQLLLQETTLPPRLVLGGDEARLCVRPGTTAEQRIAWMNEWYREQMKIRVEISLPEWSRRTGLVPSSWQTKYMTTRWGTCNTATRKIWLNPQLAKRPPECLEYVILHELAHLRVRNHGPEFKKILDMYMPGWRAVRKRLNQAAPDAL